MHQKITGQVDSTYSAQSHSLVTLRDWHYQHSHVSKLVLSSQVIFPITSGTFLVLYFIYLIECEPNDLGKKLNSQMEANSRFSLKISNAAKSKVWIFVYITIIFTTGAIIVDIIALTEYNILPKEIESYINDKSEVFTYLHVIPITMLAFDLLSTLFILVPIVVAGCKYFRCCKRHNSAYCECCGIKGKFKFSDFLYTLLSPLLCIATHSYHIVFAFINNPYHATSVLLLYMMTLFVVVIVFQKIYYFVLICFPKYSTYDEKKGLDACMYCIIFLFCTFATLVMTVCIGLTVVVLLVLPLNNAIDQASNQIYAIYQASVTVFTALLTFQVFFRETNSIFAVFIKAADKQLLDPSTTDNERNTWGNMSEKEKEIHLGEKFLKHIDFKLPQSYNQPQPDRPFNLCHCLCCTFRTYPNYVNISINGNDSAFEKHEITQNSEDQSGTETTEL